MKSLYLGEYLELSERSSITKNIKPHLSTFGTIWDDIMVFRTAKSSKIDFSVFGKCRDSTEWTCFNVCNTDIRFFAVLAVLAMGLVGH